MKILIITFFTLFFLNTYLNSSISNKIIVKVGNEIITQHELENKINTTLVLSKQEIKQENIDVIKRQSLKTLINLKLKNDELKKYNLEINQIAINEHLLKISQSLNIKITELENFFLLKGINYEYFIKELETEFLWRRLIFQLFASKINIVDSEVEAELNIIKNTKKKIIEFKLAEIEVNFEENEKQKLIKEIKDSIEKKGFSSTVSKYSISSSNLNGGVIGWVNVDALSNVIHDKIKLLDEGMISQEIVIANSLFFFKILDKKITEVSRNLKLDKLKEDLIDKKKNDLLNLYSSSYLSKKKKNTLIELQ
mgnify:CR=1 FL=1